MLIVILSIVLLILGIILILVGYNKDKDCSIIIGGIFTVISGIAFISSIIIMCWVQIPKERKYQEALYEKEVIEYRIEHQDDNIVGNELLYDDIVEFNNMLRKTKLYSNNIWLNWFANDKIAKIEYIDYKK